MASSNFNMSFDPHIKAQFAEITQRYGLTVPQAFKLFANQAIHTGKLPLTFDWAVDEPNHTTKQAMNDALNRQDFSEAISANDAITALSKGLV